MLNLLGVIPLLPLLAFLVLALFGASLSRRAVARIGVGATGVSAVLAILIAGVFLSAPPPGYAFTQLLWTWVKVGAFAPQFACYLDPLSLVMMLVVTVVSFFILLYSTQYMAADEGYSRFFAYMNLFVSSMLILVLANDLLVLYLGWEGVGLCSYLLIGFWYADPANGRAAMKAFIVTRIGDAALAVGLFLLFTNLGTLNIQEAMQRALSLWPTGSALAIAAAALLLAGAVGKSAQLPLQTWLPDAMAGPTPVSALIHAATMVTAGVYLIARTHVFFTLAPPVQSLVAIIGAVTLVLAACSAMAQHDLKRVLAYSTISQVGYMFLALGVGAWTAAIFHFVTHAFFKSLLFLGAGVVIMSVRDEHDMRKMGGLRQQLPVTFWTFLIGALSLSAFPLLTAGFYSKDLILFEAWSSVLGNPWLWAAGWVGAVLTGLYAFRMVFLTFFGAEKTPATAVPGRAMRVPLLVLAVFAIIAGFIELPPTWGPVQWLSALLHPALPSVVNQAGAERLTGLLQALSVLASLAGILLAYLFVVRLPRPVAPGSRVGAAVSRFWYAGWGFDWLYDMLFVRPYLALARSNKDDVIDVFYQGIAWITLQSHVVLRRTQTGKIRRYAVGLAVGAILVIAIVVFL
ncbi:MAG TPA: NADH-quinone oxidoreductase subunit L [Armatimonadota bacterium]|jgi:NADH-quinone oxidoreductase subunit L